MVTTILADVVPSTIIHVPHPDPADPTLLYIWVATLWAFIGYLMWVVWGLQGRMARLERVTRKLVEIKPDVVVLGPVKP